MPPLTEFELEVYWRKFKQNDCRDSREAIISNYAHLVKITAGRIVANMPHGLDREDLVGAGVIGLIKAVDQFDAGRAVKFETYAIALIRGAILEMLRTEDWVPRSVREKLRAMERSFISTELRLGRPATETDIAEDLGITEQELSHLMVMSARTGVLSLDELMVGADGDETIPFVDIIMDEHANPDQEMQGRELRGLMSSSVDKLPDRERLVIALYYYEGLTFKEIGQVLSVSESRVYQLHTQAMTRIRGHMAEEGVLQVTA